jgi:hypothetical protein
LKPQKIRLDLREPIANLIQLKRIPTMLLLDAQTQLLQGLLNLVDQDRRVGVSFGPDFDFAQSAKRRCHRELVEYGLLAQLGSSRGQPTYLCLEFGMVKIRHVSPGTW